uniref:Uncharacterized protein n=1 Tax=Rhizophora mucronata TaxID=61149 RepID=A0A2P2PMR6_RHIMU
MNWNNNVVCHCALLDPFNYCTISRVKG